jgi:hypothetical protein
MLIRRIQSSSSDRVYELHIGNDGRLYCTCPGWQFQAAKKNGMCKHVAAYTSELASGVKVADAPTAAKPKRKKRQAAVVQSGGRNIDFEV